jgi:hypothetical protein
VDDIQYPAPTNLSLDALGAAQGARLAIPQSNPVSSDVRGLCLARIVRRGDSRQLRAKTFHSRLATQPWFGAGQAHHSPRSIQPRRWPIHAG